MGIPDSPWQGRATSSERGSVECAQSKPGARFWTSGRPTGSYPETGLWSLTGADSPIVSQPELTRTIITHFAAKSQGASARRTPEKRAIGRKYEMYRIASTGV
jgi:hypothetical protein